MLQSYTRHASLLSVAPLEENQDTSNQRELRILPGQDFPSVYSLRTRYATLWRVSLVGLTLSDKAFQSLGCFVGLGFLDLSYTNLSLKTIQSALRPIQILSLHIFSCPHLESVERGFLVYTLPNTWSLNGLIPTCTQRVQYKQSYTAGKGRFSEVYRKHFLPFDPKLVPTRLWPVEQAANPNLHEIQIGCLWSPQAKLLASNVPQHFAMGLEQDLWRTKRLAFNLETDILAALHASKADVQVIRSSIEHFISPPSSGSDGSSLNSLDSRSRLLLLLLATMTSGLSIDLFQRALETIFCGSDSQWTASSISPISWPLKYRLIYAAMLLARLSIQSPTGQIFFLSNSL